MGGENTPIGLMMTVNNVTSEDMAENAQQDFIAHVAHELLTPLTNTYIRANEVEADIFGLNAAREPEGFAEVSSQLACGHEAGLEQAMERFERSRDPMTFGLLNRQLDDLGSPVRQQAFVHATAAVCALVARRGAPEVFLQLAHIAADLGEDED